MPKVEIQRDDIEEDYLEADEEIPGQKFVCLSFISPEKILENKQLYFFEKFMKFYEGKIKFDAFERIIAEYVIQHNRKIQDIDTAGDEGRQELIKHAQLNVSDLFDFFRSRVEENKTKFSNKQNIKEEYDAFLYNREKELEDKFHEENNFQTTVRGLKVRGVFANEKEANLRAKKLQKKDPLHNVFVGSVGFWLPWDPSPDQLKEQEYAEKELNELMKKHQDNQERSKELFEKEKEERVKKAKEEARLLREKQITEGNIKIQENNTENEDAQTMTNVEARDLMVEMSKDEFDPAMLRKVAEKKQERASGGAGNNNNGTDTTDGGDQF